eukprot:1586155-Pyramimonas_sp.AAC.1
MGIPLTFLQQSRVLCIDRHRPSPIRNYSLRPWNIVGHDTSPRCRSRVGGPTQAGAPAVRQLP